MAHRGTLKRRILEAEKPVKKSKMNDPDVFKNMQEELEKYKMKAKKAENELKELKISRYFSKKFRFPPVTAQCNKNSYTKSKHIKVDLVSEGTFGILQVSPSEKKCSVACNFQFQPPIQYSSESDLQSYVRSLMKDMVTAIGFQDSISIISERGIASFRADFWVVLQGGIPIGAIEVKLPGVNVLNEPRVLGQIFDYMLRLRNYYGIRQVFGLVTTFEEWRVVWLPDTDVAATAGNLDYPIDSVVDLTEGSREIMASQIYYLSNCVELATCLTSVLKKMKRSAEDRIIISLTGPNRSYITSSSNSWSWQTRETSPELTLLPPSKNTTNFHLLRDYHGGGDGRVWLAASKETGSLSVIKFLCGDSDAIEQKKAAHEAAVWRKLGFTAYSCKLMGKHSVVMPYALHVKLDGNSPRLISSLNAWTSSDDTSDMTTDDLRRIKFYSELMTAVQEESRDLRAVLCEAVEFVAANSISHEDLEWRHVALIPIFVKHSNGTFAFERCRATLIDFTRSHFSRTKELALAEMKLQMENLLTDQYQFEAKQTK